MRLVSFDAGEGPRAGLLEKGLVVEVGDSVMQLIETGLDALPAARGEPRPLTDVALLPPIGNPQKIIGIGLNYRSHADEAGREPPEVPTFFGKFANALAAPGAQVALPQSSAKVDYEAEVAFVVGRRAKSVSEGAALDHIAGYMLFNDLSARDLQFQTPQWMPGKVFDRSAPCGPALVTAEEGIDPSDIELALTLNGEQMQSASTADLIHSIPALLAHLSRLMTLEPGDIVSTGTPAGVGSVRKPRIWLAPGDEIVISSPQLGELTTYIT